MHRSRHHPVLGTVVDVRIAAADVDPEVCERIDAALIAEMVRLEAVFSVFDADSELERWKRGDVPPGPELSSVLTLALEWQRRSAGAFNLGARSLHELWRSAEVVGQRPAPGALADAVAAIADPPYRVGADGEIETVRSVEGIDLNALAKGWIVDRAVERALFAAAADGVDVDGLEVIVSAGGDLRHRGRRPFRIGIEHPLRPYDNEPPIAHVEVCDAALATSGGSRRGFRVGGTQYSHVIDPRSGEPVDAVASVSVLAPDTATADVVATIAGLESPSDALVIAERFATAALAVAPTGRWSTSERWPRPETGPVSSD